MQDYADDQVGNDAAFSEGYQEHISDLLDAMKPFVRDPWPLDGKAAERRGLARFEQGVQCGGRRVELGSEIPRPDEVPQAARLQLPRMQEAIRADPSGEHREGFAGESDGGTSESEEGMSKTIVDIPKVTQMLDAGWRVLIWKNGMGSYSVEAQHDNPEIIERVAQKLQSLYEHGVTTDISLETFMEFHFTDELTLITDDFTPEQALSRMAYKVQGEILMDPE